MNSTYNQLIALAKQLIDQSESYSIRKTKAESKRMRSTMNDMKKLITPAKEDLLTDDKG